MAGTIDPCVGAAGIHVPALSSLGTHLAYQRTGPTSELWVADCRDGGRTLVSDGAFTFHEWLPGEDALIYGIMPRHDGCEGLCAVSPDTLQRRVVLPPDAVRRFGGVTADGARIAYAEADPRTGGFTTHALDVTSCATTVLYRGRPALVPAHWRPDGTALVLSEPDGELGSKLFLLDTSRGELHPLCDGPDRTAYCSCGWMRDGSGLYVITNRGEEYAGLATIAWPSLHLEYIARCPFDIERATLSSCGRYLALLENRYGYSHLMVRDLFERRDLRIPALPSGVMTLTWARQAPVLAIHTEGPGNPGSIQVWALDSNRCHLVVASEANGHRAKAPHPEHVFFSSSDDVALHGLLHLPEDAGDGPPAVVVSLHGGPTAQARPTFNALHVGLLANGIAVFELNYRGSSGYGRTFAALNDVLQRDNELLDVEAAVGWLQVTRGFSPQNVFVLGHSYGGYLAMATMTRRPRLVGGGVGVSGVYDWVRALEAASAELQLSDRVEYGDVCDPICREFLESISPLAHASRVERPVLLVHGVRDPVVAVSQSDLFAGALHRAGCSVHYIRLAEVGHRLAPGLPSTTGVHTAIARFIHGLVATESASVQPALTSLRLPPPPSPTPQPA